MLRSSSCWFEFYSVIIERERETDRDRETGGREERQGERKRGKEKEKGEKGEETGREETHIHRHKGDALPTRTIISGSKGMVKDSVVGLIFIPLLDLKRWHLLLC